MPTPQQPSALRPFKPGEMRPNSDGSYSTEITTTWQLPDGQWVNVPSLWMGPNGPVQFPEDDEQNILGAAQSYEQQAGRTFQRFPTVDAATAAAQARSNAGGASAGTQGANMPDMDRMERAFRNAHKAGDAAAARKIAGAIKEARQSAAPAPAQMQSQGGGEGQFERATFLPIGQDTKTGDVSLAVPGFVKGMYESGKAAVTAPGRAMRGELDVMGPDGATPEAIQEALNMAVWATPAPAARATLGPAAVKPKPQGLKVAEAAGRQGIDLPRAAISDKVAVQQAGKTVANIPLAGTPLRKASEKAIGQLDDAARSVEQGYGTGSVPGAGSMVRSDVTDFAKKTLTDLTGKRYDAVDDLVQPNVVTQLSKTKQIADDILAKRQNAQLPGDSKAVEMIRQAASSPQGMNYQGIKTLRTSVGEILDDPLKLSGSGMSQGELKRIYGGLTDDLRNAVKRGGGDDALKAWEDANAFAAKAAADRKALQKVIGTGAAKSDEAIVDGLEKMAGSSSRADISKLAKARTAVSKETWDELTSSVLSRMGRDADGNFSPDRFLTAYGKLSDGGKGLLFRTTGKKDLARSLDDIAEVSRRFKQLNQFANPSGTGQTIMSGGIGAGLVTEPITTLTGVAGGRIVASMLSKPMTAEKVAKWAKAYEQAAKNPSPATRALLEDRTKALTLAITAERGIAVPLLNSPSKAIADPEDSGPRRDENEDNGQDQYDPYMI